MTTPQPDSPTAAQPTPVPAEGVVIEGEDEGSLNAPEQRNIRLNTADRSLAELKRWYDDNQLILDPDWQRNYVWNQTQASRLIESFLLDIPVPVVYLAKDEDNRYEVIDGQQRLRSAFNFFNDEFKLQGLDMLTDLMGKSYKSLSGSEQRKLRDTTLRSFELASDTENDVHFLVFERLNTGGTKLNEMEIRNCIFRGGLNDLIKDLSGNQDFIKTINQSNLSTRMKDRAFVLRFLAFHERTHLKCTHGLKRFLNEFFQTYRDPNAEKIKEYTQVFNHCMKASLTVFGEHGFRLKKDEERSSSQGGWSPTPNIAIFQAIATSFASYDLSQITRASDRINEAYLDMLATDEKWKDYVRYATGGAARIKYVFEAWHHRLEEALEHVPANDSQRVFSRELKQELFDQDSTCKICHQEIRLLDDAAVDHIEHYWRGGATISDNARLTHRHCNASRGGRE